MKMDRIRTLMIVSCFTLAIGATDARQHPVSEAVVLGIATSQTGAPVGLRGYLASAGTFLYETAKVQNLSPKPIFAVTFGVFLADPANRNPSTTLRSDAVGLTLAPGETRDINVRLLPTGQLEELQRSFSSTPKVTLGVLAVEWADGTKWVFDIPEGATDFSTGTGRMVEASRP
jgi:hypothetical protein